MRPRWLSREVIDTESSVCLCGSHTGERAVTPLLHGAVTISPVAAAAPGMCQHNGTEC